MNQNNNELSKDNDMLASEKKLLENELNLIDNNNNDARNHIKVLENELDIELNGKEAEEQTNHGLKQNLIDLSGKIELLNKELFNLEITYEKDLKQENLHLTENLDKTKMQLIESIKLCDELRANNNNADINLDKKINLLENMKQESSIITLGLENDLTNLNKTINDKCKSHNISMREIEQHFQDKCHEHDLVKQNKINNHNNILYQKENIINDLNNELQNDKNE